MTDAPKKEELPWHYVWLGHGAYTSPRKYRDDPNIPPARYVLVTESEARELWNDRHRYDILRKKFDLQQERLQAFEEAAQIILAYPSIENIDETLLHGLQVLRAALGGEK